MVNFLSAPTTFAEEKHDIIAYFQGLRGIQDLSFEAWMQNSYLPNAKRLEECTNSVSRL